MAEVFPAVAHQICEFHILKELTKAALRVVARIRKQIAAQAPPLGRGRPRTPQAKRTRQRRPVIQQRVSQLFEHRSLLVRHHLTASQRARLKRLIRREPRLRALRALMDEVYHRFDRRCRTATALAKLAHLRPRLRRFKSLGRSLDKLKSPNLEKALTFLDDKLLPATSKASIVGRMALDLQRDQQANGRQTTTTCLHQARTQPTGCQL